MFKGNVNTFLAELRELHPPIIARRIRFVPHASHPRTVCMRVELYGCSWTGMDVPRQVRCTWTGTDVPVQVWMFLDRILSHWAYFIIEIDSMSPQWKVMKDNRLYLKMIVTRSKSDPLVLRSPPLIKFCK